MVYCTMCRQRFVCVEQETVKEREVPVLLYRNACQDCGYDLQIEYRDTCARANGVLGSALNFSTAVARLQNVRSRTMKSGAESIRAFLYSGYTRECKNLA